MTREKKLITQLLSGSPRGREFLLRTFENKLSVLLSAAVFVDPDPLDQYVLASLLGRVLSEAMFITKVMTGAPIDYLSPVLPGLMARADDLLTTLCECPGVVQYMIVEDVLES